MPRDTPTAQPATSEDRPHDDDALASTMLLTLGDFQAGWVERAVTRSSDPELDRCVSNAGRTGRAESRDFAPSPDAASMYEIIKVFDTAASATAAVEQTGDALKCEADVFNRGHLDDASARYTNAATDELTHTKFGDVSHVFRRSFTIHASTGDQHTVHGLIVFVAAGRVAFAISLEAAVAPPDDVLDEIANYALRKIHVANVPRA